MLQLALYSELLTAVQGHPPEWMHVALGGSARTVEHLRVATTRRTAGWCGSCSTTSWRGRAVISAVDPPGSRRALRRLPLERRLQAGETDEPIDLSLVAGIIGRQRRGLRDHAVTTRRGLAGMAAPDPRGRSRVQARRRSPGSASRHASRCKGSEPDALLYELLDPERHRTTDALLPNLRPAVAAGAVAGRPVLRHRGRPVRARRRRGLPLRHPRAGRWTHSGQPTFHRIWSTRGDRHRHASRPSAGASSASSTSS